MGCPVNQSISLALSSFGSYLKRRLWSYDLPRALKSEMYSKGGNQQRTRKFPSLKWKKEDLQDAVFFPRSGYEILVFKTEARWADQANNVCIFLEVIISQSSVSWIETSMCAQHSAFYKIGNMDSS